MKDLFDILIEAQIASGRMGLTIRILSGHLAVSSMWGSALLGLFLSAVLVILVLLVKVESTSADATEAAATE